MFKFKDEFNMWWKALIVLCTLTIVIESQISDEDDISAQPEQVKKPTKISSWTGMLPQITTIPPPMKNAYTTFEVKFVVGEHQIGEILAFEQKSEVLWFGRIYGPEITLRYPSSGEGRKITAVEVIATQTTPMALLDITHGGPGFRNVEVFLRAHNTFFWTYHFKVYGKIFK